MILILRLGDAYIFIKVYYVIILFLSVSPQVVRNGPYTAVMDKKQRLYGIPYNFVYEGLFTVSLHINYGTFTELLPKGALRYVNEAVYALFSDSLMETLVNYSYTLSHRII
jgi:hypothetical protein